MMRMSRRVPPSGAARGFPEAGTLGDAGSGRPVAESVWLRSRLPGTAANSPTLARRPGERGRLSDTTSQQQMLEIRPAIGERGIRSVAPRVFDLEELDLPLTAVVVQDGVASMG
jgi:hypothetical protein